MPRRGTVLAAKAVVVALVAFVVSEAALGVTLLGTALIVGSRAINGQAPLAVGDLTLLVAMGLSTTSFAMIGLGLGAISRSALASVVSLVLLWYIARQRRARRVLIAAASVPAILDGASPRASSSG